jgi:pimeloyl-ACP methyl ester carboxylesterase
MGAAPFSVLALHGWGRDHHDFDALFASGLPAGISALAVDLPGFGATPPPPSPWGSEQYAEALIGLFGQLTERAVLLGHSFGGRIALQLAADHPGRFGGLVLTGVPLFRDAHAPPPARAYRAIRRLASLHLVPPARLEAARRRHGSADYRAAEGVMREVLVRVVAERYDDLLPRVTAPVELVWGSEDTTTPLRGAERALSLLPRARLTTLEHAGHMVPLEHADVLGAAITRLLP